MADKQSKYGLLGRLNPEDLYNAFLGVDEQKQIAIVVGLALILIAVIVFPVSCASSKISAIKDEYTKTKEGAGELLNKVASYQHSKEELDQIKSRLKGGGGSLSTVIEGIANEIGIASNIEKIRPLTIDTNDLYDQLGADVVVSKVTLDQAVSLLDKIQNNPNAHYTIEKLQIKPRYDNRQSLTLTFQVSMIQLKGDANE